MKEISYAVVETVFRTCGCPKRFWPPRKYDQPFLVDSKGVDADPIEAVRRSMVYMMAKQTHSSGADKTVLSCDKSSNRIQAWELTKANWLVFCSRRVHMKTRFLAIDLSCTG